MEELWGVPQFPHLERVRCFVKCFGQWLDSTLMALPCQAHMCFAASVLEPLPPKVHFQSLLGQAPFCKAGGGCRWHPGGTMTNSSWIWACTGTATPYLARGTFSPRCTPGIHLTEAQSAAK